MGYFVLRSLIDWLCSPVLRPSTFLYPIFLLNLYYSLNCTWRATQVDVFPFQGRVAWTVRSDVYDESTFFLTSFPSPTKKKSCDKGEKAASWWAYVLVLMLLTACLLRSDFKVIDYYNSPRFQSRFDRHAANGTELPQPGKNLFLFDITTSIFFFSAIPPSLSYVLDARCYVLAAPSPYSDCLTPDCNPPG